MSPMFYVILGACCAESIRIIIEKIASCIKKKQEKKKRAANRAQWMADLFHECNRPIGPVYSLAKTTTVPIKKVD